jgi:hypothetical protein
MFGRSALRLAAASYLLGASSVGLFAATAARIDDRSDRPTRQGRASAAPRDSISQLRVFTINRGQLDRFVDAWRRGVYPLRLRHGFRIDGAWVIPERNEFLWVLSYDGPEGFRAKDSAYYASAERGTLDPDPVQFIARAERWFVTPAMPRRR